MATAQSEAVRKAIGQGAKKSSIGILVTAAAVLIVAGVGVVLALNFIESERQRELNQWQARMSIIVDSRQNDVRQWVESQLGEMRGLAENQSLQLYMTLLHQEGVTAESPNAPPELGYLSNLLTVVADRTGFQADIGGPEVNANVSRTGSAGIALIDQEGRIVVSSPGMPPISGALGAFVTGTPRGQVAVSDLFEGPGGKPAMAFLAPVFAIQGDSSAASQVATVIGVKEVGEELFPLLAQPGDTNQTAETMIVRQDGSTVLYLSPLRDGAGPLERKIAMSEELAAAWAIRTPNGFAIKTNYANVEVLAVSRAYPRTNWTILYTVATSEALAEATRRQNQLLWVFGGLIALVIAGGLALWYYGSSQRATQAAADFEKLATRFQGQRDFMHLVTDSQPNMIVIFDEGGHYRWFNKTALEFLRVPRRDLFDKHATAILGPSEGRRIAGWVKECLAKGEASSYTHELALGDQSKGRIYQSGLIPLPARDDLPPGVLMVSQDITESVRERQRREAAMQQLVGTLVSVVDQRDPYSAHHSVRVGEVARAIADEMGLEPGLSETTAIAGSLMNLGKITVPPEILTKQGKLTDEEMRLVQDSVQVSARLVEGVDFEGPVAETIRQLGENWDGSGTPRSLKGEEILVTARIAAVSNAFVGLVSARAWRDGMPFDKAVDILLSDAGRKYDRGVVIALANRLDNRGGRQEWMHFGKRPEAAE